MAQLNNCPKIKLGDIVYFTKDQYWKQIMWNQSCEVVKIQEDFFEMALLTDYSKFKKGFVFTIFFSELENNYVKIRNIGNCPEYLRKHND